MQLVERHIFLGRNARVMESLCHAAGLLFNITNYDIKQSVLGFCEKFSEYEYTGLCAEFDQFDYRNLPAQTSQQVIKGVFQDWKSFWASIKDYKKNPSKYRGRPKYPRYKKGAKLHVVTFTKQQIKIRNGYIYFPKSTELEPLKTLHDSIQQVRLVPQTNCIAVEVVYEQEVAQVPVDEKLFLSVDMGINNLATAISNTGDAPFIINGKPLKSDNQFYNKETARLKSFVGGKGTSNRLKKLTYERNQKVDDYIHKTSDYIVEYAVKWGISTIVIGKNDGWKQEVKMRKKTNQHFVSIPHAKLIKKIEYKAALVGIKVVLQEESYTSKCDHLAGEKMEHHDKYLGRRIKRGLFQSSTGVLINGDVNGAIGIALKAHVADDSFVKTIVSRGLAFNPRKVYLAK